MGRYFLPRHVYFCCRGTSLVFLDLKQDDYTLVDGDAANAIRAVSSTTQSEESTLDLSSTLKDLREGGLLTTDPVDSRSILPTRIQVAMEALVDVEASPLVRVNAQHIIRFAAACICAAIRLRWSHIEQTVRSVEKQKSQAAPWETSHLEKARELTAVFLKLRSLFPKNYRCLYDSLALIKFLGWYQIYPTWVFGVRLEPWAAHCWIQEGPFVFNEGVEEAASYTPVMAI